MGLETRMIASWHDITRLAEEFKTENWIFRGVEVHTYELIPKIGRCEARKSLQGTKIGYSAEVGKVD
jgi:hypothetical protein